MGPLKQLREVSAPGGDRPNHDHPNDGDPNDERPSKDRPNKEERWLWEVVATVALAIALPQTGLCGDIYGKVNSWPAVSGGLAARPGVVWLAGASQRGLPTPTPGKLTMAQSKGRFVPPFLVVVAGQTVAMPNQDEVAHNVYSNSPLKTFNLGFYAKAITVRLPSTSQAWWRLAVPSTRRCAR